MSFAANKEFNFARTIKEKMDRRVPTFPYVLLTIFFVSFVVSCSNYDASTDAPVDSSSSISSEEYDYLLGKYTRFVEIYTEMNKSSSGEDTRNAYYACLDLVNSISQKTISANNQYLREYLQDGISQMAQGFGCFSNKKLCKNDAEAIKLLASGRAKLDIFLKDINSLSISMPTPVSIPLMNESTPTKVDNNGDCVLWSDVSNLDVGKTLCVYGKVRNSWYSENQGAHIITFSGDPKAFYFIMYGNWTFDSLDGICVNMKGTIERVYDTPVIYLPEKEPVYFCPE